jgi:hypothetical protein
MNCTDDVNIKFDTLVSCPTFSKFIYIITKQNANINTKSFHLFDVTFCRTLLGMEERRKKTRTKTMEEERNK